MTIDENGPDEIPANEKDESPNSKEITEKVSKTLKSQKPRNPIKCSDIEQMANTISIRIV